VWIVNDWLPEDLDDLARAKRCLEQPGLAVRLTDLIGRPIEGLAALLPDTGRDRVDRAVQRALERALTVALSTTRNYPLRPASYRFHRFAGAVSGAVGGFFGLPGLIVELPATTILMLRSIVDIARSQGFDLHQPETRIQCLEVFAYGGANRADDAVETGYYAVRAAMASAVTEAVQHVATRGMTARGAPALVRLIDKIAVRFGLVVQEKVALEMFPVLGAVSGATVNTVFMGYFQRVGWGHFTVRRFETLYGEESTREAYRRVGFPA
jgi:hypothetical protein